MNPAKHSAICAEIQQLHQAKESKLLARIKELEAHRKPLTHEQRLDVITEFEKHRMKWDDISILIDLVEAAHGIKENT